MPESVQSNFPLLQTLDPATMADLVDNSARISLPAGAKAFEPGMSADNLLMVTRGRVRVQQVSESGREIVLYRLEGGETCVLTTACLLAHEDYAAEAVAETEVEALAVPRSLFDRLIGQSKAFRDFVFSAYASRITDLLLLVEEVAFGHLDVRLAQRLLELARDRDVLALTHQDLAVELGTAREVISRQLKEFERRGEVKLERGRIEILNRDALQARAALTGL